MTGPLPKAAPKIAAIATGRLYGDRDVQKIDPSDANRPFDIIDARARKRRIDEEHHQLRSGLRRFLLQHSMGTRG